MKSSCKIILSLSCMLIVGVMNLDAADLELTDGKLVGYGLTNATIGGETKQIVIIKILENSTNRNLAYIIDGSPYCDYIFNILANPDTWDEDDRFDATYDSTVFFTDVDNTVYHEIKRIFLK